MASPLISRCVVLTLGTLYPAYKSYKGVKTKNVREYVRWMMYWIVFALYLCLEALTDILVSFWFPFYYEIKILLVIWLMSPYTRGASMLYRKFLHPFLLNHEDEIDACLDRVKRESYTKMITLGNRGISYAREAVAIAALRGHEHIMRKTVSLNDVTDSPSRPLRNAIQYTSQNDVGDEEMEFEPGSTPTLAKGATLPNKRTRKPRHRPGLAHVVKTTAKLDGTLQTKLTTDSAIIDEEFGYLNEHDTHHLNDDAIEEESEIETGHDVVDDLSRATVSEPVSSTVVVRRSKKINATPVDGRATLPRRSGRKIAENDDDNDEDDV